MINVKFHDNVEDELLKFAVIVSKYNGKWVFCKHKNRNTYEVPGGHREDEEDIINTAKRELYEETGAVSYELKEVCVYSVEDDNDVTSNGQESYGMLYYADIKELGVLPDMEMELVVFFENIPEELTYPLIQPKLVDQINEFLKK